MRGSKPFVPIGLILLGCGEAPIEPMPPDVAPPPVVRPERVEALTAEVELFTLPSELAGDPALSIAQHASGTLIGGAGGLFQIAGSGIVPVDAASVTALASLESFGIVVGRTDGVSLWDGSLVESPLSEAIESMRVSSLFERGGALFIGTDTSFYLLEEGELSEFESIDGASRLAGYSAGQTIVIDDRIVLASGASGWSIQDLGDEIAAEQTIPAAGDRIFAAKSGALFERIAVEEGVVWRKVALTTDEADEGAEGVRFLATDPISGTAWIVTGDRIARIAGKVVSSAELPAGLGAPITARTTGGVLWISDGISLARIGQDDGPVTFAKDIAAFSANNCERCHTPLGVAHPLGSYETWKAEIDLILLALDEMRMPEDGAPLVGGTVELVRAWKTDGLLP